uniref:Uncharacterized protein n=1 Tax=viral metagenome TaxID=1070528 RepID=A0A6H2A065_9ZZZZ
MKKTNKWDRQEENRKSGKKPVSKYARKKGRGMYNRLKDVETKNIIV